MDYFTKRLLTWFDQHGRHNLPWQRDATPYHVWLSEIMLQQTQVATVIPYYERFVAAFPTLDSLANAPEDAVLHRWSGLGYYARARNLHRAAKVLMEEHGGLFPANLDALISLPGVGRSTAGAILCIALGGRAPILDGNVKRVLARYHSIGGWPGSSAVAGQLWEKAELHTPQERVADYTQAIMDLGATLCTRGKPACKRCPQMENCTAHAAGSQAEFPGRKAKKVLPIRQTTLLIACTPQGELFLERRPPSGIWGGLWCFPEAASEQAAENFCLDVLGTHSSGSLALPLLRHSFSHYHLEISPLLLTLSTSPKAIGEGERLCAWPAHSLPEVGLASPVKRLWLAAAETLTNAATHRGEYTA
ncbi:MAG: A/G-specific adenine glycosylase [Halieaceae bacterium]|jgi:A/G-specific adenine glycosylase